MTPRLKLAMEQDGPSRGRYVRDVVQRLLELRSVRGALLVAPDGFVIAADVPGSVAVEALAATSARLGRELQASATRMGHAAFSAAMFSTDDGAIFVAAAGIGYVVVLADPEARLEAVRGGLDEAVELIRAAWSRGEGAPSAS